MQNISVKKNTDLLKNFKGHIFLPSFNTDTVAVIVQYAYRLLDYYSYSIGIIPKKFLDYFILSNGIITRYLSNTNQKLLFLRFLV